MTPDTQPVGPLRRLLGTAGIVFGVATIAAGGRVVAGTDPGYIVYWPLLYFNTTMGAVYVAAGILMWRSLGRGRRASGSIAVLNLVVLGAISWLHATGAAVAIDSVRAMILRTAVWLLLFLGMRFLVRDTKVVVHRSG